MKNNGKRNQRKIKKREINRKNNKYKKKINQFKRAINKCKMLKKSLVNQMSALLWMLLGISNYLNFRSMDEYKE